MTLKELRYLVAVADLRHFGRAAERCNVTQPTLSAQIKKLEQYLGAELIVRTHHSVCLTPLGREIAALARVAVTTADMIKHTARNHGQSSPRVLRDGADEPAGIG